jgi:hypothetical protein
MTTFFAIAAFILFVIATLPVPSKINLAAAGLACLTLAMFAKTILA